MMIFVLPFARRIAERGYMFCQRLPTNRLVRHVRTPHGLRWGIPVALLGVVYFAVGAIAATAVQHGASGWLNLVFLLCFWNALKLSLAGSVATLRWVFGGSRKAAPRA